MVLRPNTTMSDEETSTTDMIQSILPYVHSRMWLQYEVERTYKRWFHSYDMNVIGIGKHAQYASF